MNRSEIVAAMRAWAVVKPRPVPVDGVTFYLRHLTVADALADKNDEPQEIQAARNIARRVVTEDGEQVWDSKDDAAVAEILQMDWSKISQLIRQDDKKEETETGKAASAKTS